MRRHIQSNFNGGEWSPLMDARVQLAKYSTSLRTMLNYIPTIYGTARKRQGLEFLGLSASQDHTSRLIPFRFDNDNRYIVEFSQNVIRFWQDGQLLIGSDIVSDYTEEELPLLRFQSINDVIFIAHPNHPLKQLSRVTPTTWELNDFEFTNEPFNEDVTQDIGITADPNTNTITSALPFFDASHVGQKIQLLHTVQDVRVSENHEDAYSNSVDSNLNGANHLTGSEIRFNTNDTVFTVIQDYNFATDFNVSLDPADYPTFFQSGVVLIDPVLAQGGWEFETEGIWRGTVRVQQSDDGLTNWQTIHTLSSDENQNFIRTGDATTDNVYLRVVVDEADTGSGEGTMTLTLLSFEEMQIATITGLVSPTQVNVVFDDPANDIIQTQTLRYSFNEWNDTNGYPSQVVLHDSRLYLAGNRLTPQQVWGSEVDNFRNFMAGTEDSDPLRFIIASGNQDPIRFLQVQKDLIVGTSRSIWSVRGTNESVVTPSSIRVLRESGRGTAEVDAVAIDDSVIYVQEGRRNIRDSTNDFQRGGYISAAINIAAEHITQSGINYLAYQQNRESIIWAVRDDGKVACCAYEKDQDVNGWYLFETDGLIENVNILPTDGEEDEIYMTVLRRGGRFIERLSPEQYRVQDEARIDECFFVDSGITYEGAATQVITGLDHLEGEIVQVLSEGNIEIDQTVQAGSITIGRETTRASVGLKYTGLMRTQRTEILTSQGTAQGAEIKISEIVVDLFNSIGVEFSDRPDGVFQSLKFQPSGNIGLTNQLESGAFEVNASNRHEFDSSITLKSEVPLPSTIRSIVIKYDIKGR